MQWRRLTIGIVTMLSVLGSGATAFAQPVNADLNTGVEGWILSSNGTAAVFWSPMDAFSPWVPTSGSALITGVGNQDTSSTFAYLLSGKDDPEPLVSGATYLVGGFVSVDRSATGGSVVQFIVNWSTDGSCFGSGVIRTDFSQQIPEGTPWRLSWTALTAPPSATSYCMGLRASNGRGAHFSVRLDKAFFVKLP